MAKWLKCDVQQGMFSDEFTVIVQTRSGGRMSFFVPRAAADNEQKRVKVRVAEREGYAIATLPDDLQSTVDVSNEALAPA